MKKIANIKKFVKAIALTGILIVLAVVLNNLYAQNKDKETPPKSIGNQPKVSVNVNKQTDKNGNITRYDSTYSWSWSSNGKPSPQADSIMISMQERISKGFPFKDRVFGLNDENFADSGFFSDNFEGMFDKNFSNLDNMFGEQEKMLKKYFNPEPKLKLPDGVKPLPPKKPVIKEKKENMKLPMIPDNQKIDI